jgi:hypothetical protein
VSENPVALDRSAKRRRRLRLAGVGVLLLGLTTAGLVYWCGTRGADWSADPAMAGLHKAQERRMGVLYGDMGLLAQEWYDDLKRPGTQAAIILGISGLLAAGCFFFARWPIDSDELS